MTEVNKYWLECNFPCKGEPEPGECQECIKRGENKPMTDAKPTQQDKYKRGINHSKWRGGKITYKCIICSKEKSVFPNVYIKGSHKYCSHHCQGIGRLKQKIERTCKICNKKLLLLPKRIRKGEGSFCSYRCMGKWRTFHNIGEKNSNWRGGITPETRQRLNAPEWKETRKKVYKRDGYKCQICGMMSNELKKIKQKIIAHHITPYRITQNNEIDNLITLCSSCHMREEKKYYHSQNEQLKLF